MRPHGFWRACIPGRGTNAEFKKHCVCISDMIHIIAEVGLRCKQAGVRLSPGDIDRSVPKTHCELPGFSLARRQVPEIRQRAGLCSDCALSAHSKLKFVAAMNRHHAGRQIEVLDALQTGRFHHLLQFLLPGMHADGLGEIPVTVRVTRDELPHPGQQFE